MQDQMPGSASRRRRIRADLVEIARRWTILTTILRQIAASEIRGRAVGLLVILVGLSLAVNGLNVLNSFVGRDVITALEQKMRPEFLHYAALYLGVFVAQTAVAVSFRFSEERLGVLWREWLTGRLLTGYLSNHAYLRLKVSAAVSNPDQRMTEDVRALTTTSLSLFLMFLNGSFAIVGFSGVLWSIHPQCFVVAVVYALFGTLFTLWLGRPLVRLNYDQLDREAELRAGLVRVWESAESVALTQREESIGIRLRDQLSSIVGNAKKIIAVNRNLSVFTTGYSYLAQIIPIIVVAPLFIRGEVQFGAITQAIMAFSVLVGAFSLIVTQFSALSSYAAVLERTGAVLEALEAPAPGIGSDQGESVVR